MLSGTRPFAIADGLVESKHPYLKTKVGMEVGTPNGSAAGGEFLD
jgi:hypothetical protein